MIQSQIRLFPLLLVAFCVFLLAPNQSEGFPLEVQGNDDILGLISTGSIASGMVLDATVNSGHKYHLYSTTAAAGQGAGYFLITDETASWADRLAINPSGNVGIGTSAPAYKLHVNGSVAGTSAYVNLSDARQKKNVQPLQIGLKEIAQLKPVSFEWKTPKDIGMQGRQIGFVAQDVEIVIPALVTTEDNKDHTKGLKYTDMIAVLTKAIQELKASEDKLRADFEAYRKAHP